MGGWGAPSLGPRASEEWILARRGLLTVRNPLARGLRGSIERNGGLRIIRTDREKKSCRTMGRVLRDSGLGQVRNGSSLAGAC